MALKLHKLVLNEKDSSSTSDVFECSHCGRKLSTPKGSLKTESEQAEMAARTFGDICDGK